MQKTIAQRMTALLTEQNTCDNDHHATFCGQGVRDDTGDGRRATVEAAEWSIARAHTRASETATMIMHTARQMIVAKGGVKRTHIYRHARVPLTAGALASAGETRITDRVRAFLASIAPSTGRTLIARRAEHR